MKEKVMSVLRNPALMLAWGLPAVAVLASFVTLFIAMNTPDGELPEQYHWEGFQLDRDFSRAARAAELGVRSTFTGFDQSGRCQAELRMNGAAPDDLVLRVSHATLPHLDQSVMLKRMSLAPAAESGSATYVGDCQQAAEGHWRLELVDAVNDWALRQSVHGSLGGVTLDATS
jgi:hypothetical protein